jgi:hypothetical protein
MTTIIRGVTVDQLPDAPASGVQLWCAHCQAGYSACRGDYFWMPPGQPFRCQTCRRALQLVVERTTHERITP